MKQDDGLDDLSNILGELKVMARDMGSEIDRYLSLLTLFFSLSRLNTYLFLTSLQVPLVPLIDISFWSFAETRK
jgi:hypothetical protein